MTTDEAVTRTIRGHIATCPVCQGTRFHSERYLLNTRAATFFNFDWANRAATALVCADCKHILWFAKNPEESA